VRHALELLHIVALGCVGKKKKKKNNNERKKNEKGRKKGKSDIQLLWWRNVITMCSLR
jgi:hypothetical protein